MAKEIERKFYVQQVGLLPSYDRLRHIQSSYLSTGDPEVRISRDGNIPGSGLLTVKKGSGLVREEIETRLPDEDTEALFKMVGESPQIQKIRLHFGPWEYDEYLGRHAGLAVLEIELPSEYTQIPSFPEGLRVLGEITHFSGFKNKALATSSDDLIARTIREWTTGAPTSS